MLSSLDIYYQYKPAFWPSSFNNVIINAADNIFLIMRAVSGMREPKHVSIVAVRPYGNSRAAL